MPELCSVLAALISPMMSVTREIEVTISVIVAPARSTSAVPCSTRSTLAEMSDLISLAASALRCASERTSLATTANPRPCSPARAASTAAFSARMLVWNAMPSITPMMSTMRFELSLMPFIVTTTSPTTSPPLRATVLAPSASWLADCAFSAFWRTVEPICSIDDAASCNADACSSVRELRSLAPCEIWMAAVDTLSELARTLPTTPDRLACMADKASSSCAISSSPRTFTCVERSPPAMAWASFSASSTGRVMRRLMKMPAPAPTAPTTSISTRLTSVARCACSPALKAVAALSAAIFLPDSPSRRAGSRSMPATAASPAAASNSAALKASKPLR